MPNRRPSKAELDKAYEEVDPHWPAIVSTHKRMFKTLSKLPPMAQKQALCMLAGTWILAHRSSDDKEGFLLAGALLEQIKLYLVAGEGGMN